MTAVDPQTAARHGREHDVAPIGAGVRMDRHLAPSARRDALEADVRAGLTSTPKTLPPKWFYDARGSQLFDEITRLPEYYPTRRERAVLTAHAGDIAAAVAADTLVELGSGTSEKTRLLLDALQQAGTLRRYVPFDVDETVLAEASTAVAEEYPTIEVHAVAGDFEDHLPLLPAGGRRLVAFLGGHHRQPATRTACGLPAHPRAEPGARRRPAARRRPGQGPRPADRCLRRRCRGHRPVQRERTACACPRAPRGRRPDMFTHVALWDANNEWIEMRLRSRREQVVRVLDLHVPFAEGEELRTEISASPGLTPG